MIFNELYCCKFLNYTSNQAIKKYLLGQENPFVHHVGVRAVTRALSDRKDERENAILRAQPRAHKWCAPIDSPDQGYTF